MELGFSPTINNTFTGYSHVSSFANLPGASSYTNQYFIVDNPSGVWFINRKEAGFYKSDGTNWNFVGSTVDMTSLSDGATSVTASPITLQGTNGITTTADINNNKINISASGCPLISSGTSAPTSTPPKIGDIYINTAISTHPVFYIANGTLSSDNWIKQNGSYTMQYGATSNLSTPSANTSYYTGAIWSTNAMNIAPTGAKLWIPRAGTITSVYGRIGQITVGSSETSSMYVRVNNTTDYLITNSIINNSTTEYSNANLSIPVNKGDYILIKWLTPSSWATTPLNITHFGNIGIDL